VPIQLGCNYSRPLMDLLAQQRADVDWIKLPPFERLDEELPAARRVRPVLLHPLPHHAGCRPELWEGYPWDVLNERLREAGSPHIALHLDTLAEDWDEPLDSECQTREQAQAALVRITATLRGVRERVSIPVLVENVPYYGAGPDSWQRLRLVVQPEAIWQVVDDAGVGLILDTSHLRCTAFCLGVDPYAYARALPLAAVREIHAVGPRLIPDLGLRDRHYPMQEEDYRLLAWLLERTAPRIVTLEYGATDVAQDPERNDPRLLEEQLRRLRGMLV
jgi:uncharacterized protein